MDYGGYIMLRVLYKSIARGTTTFTISSLQTDVAFAMHVSHQTTKFTVKFCYLIILPMLYHLKLM
jgi:hypothetical protein